MTSPYHDFQIFEPKQRTIYKLPYYPDRIAHHAIMNVAKEYWTARFIKTTYSCIEGRGIHACMIDITTLLKKDVKGTKYCLKLDIRKFYPSIDHEILKLIMYKAISLYYKNQITYEQLERRFASYSGWLKYCNSKHLLHTLYLKTGLNYSNFVGKKDKISNYRGRSVYLVHVDLKHRYYNL